MSVMSYAVPIFIFDPPIFTFDPNNDKELLNIGIPPV